MTMKNLLAALVIAVAAVNGEKLRGVVFRRLKEDEPFTGTLGLQGGAGPYVKVKNDNAKKWQKLIIDDYDNDKYPPGVIPDAFAWTVDGKEPLLHSELDKSMCIQAGYGDIVQHGTKLRLNVCDKDNEFQRWDTYLHGSMKLLDDKFSGFCAASRGTNFDVDTDPMIMVDCNLLGKECGRGCFSFD